MKSKEFTIKDKLNQKLGSTEVLKFGGIKRQFSGDFASHVSTYQLINSSTKSVAFTMAEILISLTIIGVIAALTLPSLTGNISSKQFATTYKKAYATIGQALKMGSADSRDASTEFHNNNHITGLNLELGNILIENVGAKFINIANNSTLWTIRTQANSTWGNLSNKSITKESTPAAASSININSDFQVFMLKDGMSHLIVRRPTGDRCFGADKPVYVASAMVFTGRYCEAYLDVNGKKGPNTVITCANQTANTSPMPNNFGDFINNVNNTECIISGSAITDVFPVVIYDDKIIPASPAAAAILQDGQES